MTFAVVITKDRDKPRSFRWTIRAGVNQPNELPPSRAEGHLSGARRAAERVFGPLIWIDAKEAGSVYDYVVQVASVETKEAGEPNAETA